MIFLFLSYSGWNQESPEVVSIDVNSTIHDFAEEEGEYWAANEIGEAQTAAAVSGVMYYRKFTHLLLKRITFDNLRI